MFDVYVVMCEMDGVRHCMACFHTFENAVKFIEMQKEVCKVNDNRWEGHNVTFLIDELTFMD